MCFLRFRIREPNSITWKCVGGNASNLSDGVAVKSSCCNFGKRIYLFSGNAVFRYYGVYAEDTVPAAHGTIVALGITKG